ncbi:ankyrin repeat and SOCS box protein 9 [Microcaecilia unicolor]|uniref:Ankyrin repeat and SOCS box protein 9-like n=1 Tax=Microcaecilia unicolor TaxID=1415580 RepID=A0A6P7XRG1_9AMPH|nr:ankyrin repeat and SOCS box protein 9-like [Microcaecilia unicolor]
MEAAGASGKAGGSQGMDGKSSTAYISNPWMSDFVSDWSPMHDAAFHGRLLVLNKLINQGCSVNLITADGVSPLHEACLGGRLACASVLLKHGAKVDSATIKWHTPLFNACVSGSAACVNLLVQHGANLHTACDLVSPIHEAAKRGHTECVEALVSNGANLQLGVEHLGTPLYLACKNQQVECAKMLLELGANANDGKNLDSNLHLAAKNCNTDLVNLLIDFGADATAMNADGKRPAELVPPHSTLAQVFSKREGPLYLKELCRLCIRKYIGHKCHLRVAELLLPKELKDFLLFK